MEQAPASGFTCGSKRYYRDMTSCEEARFYLERCGLTRLDGDGDEVPCEELCRYVGCQLYRLVRPQAFGYQTRGNSRQRTRA